MMITTDKIYIGLFLVRTCVSDLHEKPKSPVLNKRLKFIAAHNQLLSRRFILTFDVRQELQISDDNVAFTDMLVRLCNSHRGRYEKAQRTCSGLGRRSLIEIVINDRILCRH